MIDTKAIEEHIRGILVALGDDPEREGLKDTPKRVAKMYEEVFLGMNYSNHEIAQMFDKTFEDGIEELDTSKIVVMKGSAVKIRTIPISHQTVIGKLKVILNDRTMPGIRQLLPHHLKMFKFRSELVFHLFPGILYLRQTAQVPKARMNINQIRSKRVQFFIAEHRILTRKSVPPWRTRSSR